MKALINTLEKENELLLIRLYEAEETLNAIRNGDVDAIVMNGSDGEKIFSLSSAETPYRVIIEKMNEGALILSAQGLIVYCNQRLADMFKEPIGQLTGSDFMGLINTSELQEYKDTLLTINNGVSKEIEHRVLHKGGRYFRLSFSLLPPEIMGKICVMVMDITELKEKENKILMLNLNLEQKINERTIQLKEVNAELESFTYSVAHDLRAPLRAVNSYAQILFEDYKDGISGDGRQVLENIRYNANKMGALIDELLTFSRLGRKEIKKTEIDMSSLLRSVVHELKQPAKQLTEIRIAPLPKVQADYALLYQVLINLLSNAIKYSAKVKHPLVEVSAEQQGEKTVFTVKDNGAGFDMRFANKLFGVFQRLHSEKEFEGNGVGLAIVQRIISKHGGKIWAHSKINEGASFYFTLN